MDRVMLLSGQHNNHPDLVGNALVWTDGRIHQGILRERIALLVSDHPEFSSRLVERRRGRAHWDLVNEQPPIRTHDLPLEADILRFVSTLATRPIDLEREAPVEFHLFRAEGGDVLLLRWSHLLMNGQGFDRVLGEFSRATGEGRTLQCDPVRAYLRGVPFGWKVRIATRHVRDRLVSALRENHKATVLVGPPAVVGHHASCLRVAFRELDVDCTAEVEDRARGVAGIGGLVPAIVASGLRAVARVRGDVEGSSVCRTNVPVALGSPSAGPLPVTSNLSATLPVEARGGDLDDRDALTAQVARQIREHLRSGFDLGQLLLADWLVGMAAWPTLRKLWRPQRMGVGWKPKTFGFSHRGVVPEDALSACGVRITRTHHVKYPWGGLVVVTGLCGGRLQVSVSVREQENVEGTADRIADALVEDLVSEAGLGAVTAPGRAGSGAGRPASVET